MGPPSSERFRHILSHIVHDLVLQYYIPISFAPTVPHSSFAANHSCWLISGEQASLITYKDSIAFHGCVDSKVQPELPNKSHIPGFGNWDVNGDVIITEYFEIAREGKGGKDRKGKGHADSVSDRGPSIQKRVKASNGVDSKYEHKFKDVQRHGDNSGRQRGVLPEKTAKAPPPALGVSRLMRENNSGQVLFHKATVPKSIPTRQEVYQGTSVAARPTVGAPLAPTERDVYQKRQGAMQEIYQKRTMTRPETRPSSTVRKEMGENGTHSPSSLRPINEKASSNKPRKIKALPKFGDWDLNDPTAGSGFTTIFNNARHEKKGTTPVRSSRLNAATPVDEDLYKQTDFSQKKHGEKLLSLLSKIFSGKMICQ
eukprot:Gb_13476 [translate_table: standard]